MTGLPESLAAVLAAHGIEPTTDALLGEFERRELRIRLQGPWRVSSGVANWTVDAINLPEDCHDRAFWYGVTPLAALAAAFAAMVGTEEQ